VGLKVLDTVAQEEGGLEAVKEGEGEMEGEVEGDRDVDALLLPLPLSLPLGVRLRVVVGAREVRGEGEVVCEPLA
jgi:hypothetical protein